MKTVSLLCCLLAGQAFAALDPPRNLEATALSSSKVELKWTYDSTSETGFRLQVGESAFMGRTTEIAVAMDAVDYPHTGLTPATTYYYKLKAWAMFGPDSAWTARRSATTMPGSFTATASISLPRVPRIELSRIGNAANTSISGYTIYSATNADFTGANVHFVKRTDPT